MNAYDRRTGRILTGLAVIFLAVYAWPILNPNLAVELVRGCEVASWVIWAAFGLDYATRFVLAADKRRFIRTHVLDLLVLVLPLLRPLRVLRLIPALAKMHSAGLSLRAKATTYAVAGAALLGFVSALAVLDAERNAAEANIKTFGDALWWSATTMSTTGYGDRFPLTAEGRMVGVALMFGGVALAGTITAALASWFVEAQRRTAAEE